MQICGQDLVLPFKSQSALETDEKLEWNRYVDESFTILSIDKKQGDWVCSHVQEIKKWCLTRWGFPDIEFKRECRIFCIPNKMLMKKLFGIENSTSEVRDDILVLWLLLDDKPSITIPELFTPIIFSEFENVYKTKIQFWFKKGAAELNSDLSQIKKELSDLSLLNQSDLYKIEKIFSMTEEQYQALDVKKQKLFKSQSMLLVLLLRKEFGEAKLQGFLQYCIIKDPESSINLIYGYKDLADLNAKYIKYMSDLFKDIKIDKMPDTYLQINPVYYQ